MPTVATPVISKATGNYQGPQSVTITCATPSSTIFYTTDGTTPTEVAGSPTGTTETYSTAIAVNSNTVIEAIGYVDLDTDSAVAISVIGIVPIVPPGVIINFTPAQIQLLQTTLRAELQEGYAVNPFTASQSELIQGALAALAAAV